MQTVDNTSAVLNVTINMEKIEKNMHNESV